jgi:hypothetical protein
LKVNKFSDRISLACLIGASLLYVFGFTFYSGNSMRDRVCDYAGNFDLLPVSSSSFPLSTKCPRGGSVIEIVPVWLNPTIGILLAASAAIGFRGVLMRINKRRSERFD